MQPAPASTSSLLPSAVMIWLRVPFVPGTFPTLVALLPCWRAMNSEPHAPAACRYRPFRSRHAPRLPRSGGVRRAGVSARGARPLAGTSQSRLCAAVLLTAQVARMVVASQYRSGEQPAPRTGRLRTRRPALVSSLRPAEPGRTNCMPSADGIAPAELLPRRPTTVPCRLYMVTPWLAPSVISSLEPDGRE